MTDERGANVAPEDAAPVDVAPVDADGDGTADPSTTTTPEERGRSLRQAATITAIVGIIFSALFTSSMLLLMRVPGGKASDQDLIDYYGNGDATLPVTVGLYLLPFSGIAFIWFVVALRTWAAASTRRQSILQSNVQLVSGILFIALFFVGAAATSVLAITAQYAEGPIDTDAARQFPIFGGTLIVFFAMRMAAMFVFTTSAIARSARIMPRWFAWLGFLVGLFLLLSSAFAPLLIIAFPAWVFILSLILLRHARAIPEDVRLPPRSGANMMDPTGAYRALGPRRPTTKTTHGGPS